MCAEITLFIGNLHTTVTNVSNCTLGVIRHRSCYVLTEIFMHGCSSVGPLIERVSYILCIHSPTQATMGKMNGIFFHQGRPHSYVFMETVIVLASWNPGDITVISGSVCFSDHGDHWPQVLILTVGDRRD